MFAQSFAKELSDEVKSSGIPAEVIDMKDYDPDDQLADEVRKLQRDDEASCSSPHLEIISFTLRDFAAKSILKFCDVTYLCFYGTRCTAGTIDAVY